MPLDLVVLLISENDLRSALTARLTMLGMNVVTLGPEQIPGGLPGATIANGVLITDDGGVGLGACEAQAWLQVIVLDESPSAPEDRPLRLPRTGATRHVVEALARWRDS
ncbi:MAG: hypothetical protein ACTHJR_01320 [Sphingomonas sp.]|uniref:hypothetical protein n=1 Tax=Sphingomonas sp. TaxID=28214 RepID=UPI003F7DCD3E